jgi:cobalt-zinc-cadmium resistance protein CzcA
VLERLIKGAVARRWIVLAAVMAAAVAGARAYRALPIDAVPDITNVQVQVNTEAPGLSPLEVEQRVTYPLENALAGIPGLDNTRSLSRYGLSQITAVFDDGTDVYFARQLVNQRLQEVAASLPADITPILGPIATGLGEIFMYTVGPVDPEAPDAVGPTELRAIQDWIVKPQLRNVRGVTDVNAIGGYVKQYQVAPDPHRMLASEVSFEQIVDALLRNNSDMGASFIERNGEQYLVRSSGRVQSLSDIGNIVVTTQGGTPILLDEIAAITEGHELRTGAATEGGHEVVLGTVFMLIGENSRDVAARVGERMVEINRTLPEGVVARTVYDRTRLVDVTIETVRKNLLEGAALVIAVLFLLLGNFRAALVTACVIPLSMLFTVSGMVAGGISGNLMSLGALDFGLIVDGTVIIVENCIRRLSECQRERKSTLDLGTRLAVVTDATREVARPSVFGVIIITIVYVPILALTGVEGKMFIPMAATVIMALLASLVLSITFVPAAVAVFLSGTVHDAETLPIRSATRLYVPAVHFTIRHRTAVIFCAGLLVIGSSLVATSMGREFIPTLDEGDVALHALRIPGTSVSQAVHMQQVLERRVAQMPEVERVFSKLGTAEIANDPMPPNVADGFVIMKPRALWPDPKRSKSDVVEELHQLLEEIPGNAYELTQPIQMRFNELLAGVRTDIAVKVFGDDLGELERVANEVSVLLAEIPGASDVRVEQVDGLPFMNVELDRTAMARLGVSVADVQDIVQIGVGGKRAGQVFEGDRRFDLVVRLEEGLRGDAGVLAHLPVGLPDADEPAYGVTSGLFRRTVGVHGHSDFAYSSGAHRSVPLSDLARVVTTRGPNQVSRENGKRRIVVSANVRGSDLGSFVAAASAAVGSAIELPPGYWIEWGGQFEQLVSATERLKLVVPLTLGLIFLILLSSFGSVREATVVFSGVPLALTGGVLALWLRDIPLSISAGVGFIALSGVAVLNGLVMISFIRRLRSDGMSLEDSILRGSIARLRPVLMTALVASLGFVPMAIATGTGAEVQRPLATVVIGGLISSTVLTLLVLPALYRTVHASRSRRD